jgi:hypothetical protein
MTDLFDKYGAHASLDRELGQRIYRGLIALLDREFGRWTICPSEAAKHVAREIGCEWQDLMRPVRYVAAQLADRGAIEAFQDGRAIDIREARGPIRLRLRQPAMC